MKTDGVRVTLKAVIHSRQMTLFSLHLSTLCLPLCHHVTLHHIHLSHTGTKNQWLTFYQLSHASNIVAVIFLPSNCSMTFPHQSEEHQRDIQYSLAPTHTKSLSIRFPLPPLTALIIFLHFSLSLISLRTHESSQALLYSSDTRTPHY